MVVYYHMNFANWKLVMFTGITEMYKRCVPETLIYKAASKSTPDCLNLMKVERQQANWEMCGLTQQEVAVKKMYSGKASFQGSF